MKIFYWLLALCLVGFQLHAEKHEVSNLDRVLKELPAVHGWCSEEKATCLYDLVKTIQPNVCVEIGVFGGASVLPVAVALKEIGRGKIFAIDPWDNQECVKNYPKDDINYQWWNNVDLKKIYQSYLNLIRKFSVQDVCVTLKKTSEGVVDFIPSQIDILHIDGNHSEESSMKDALNYFHKVKSGGYIIFDDFYWGTTHKAIEYIHMNCELIAELDNGNCLLFKKI